MKKTLYTFISCLSSIIFLSSSVVFAREEISVTNHIETGVVDIELDEYRKTEEGVLVPWENGITILPGMEISKIPRISNIGYDCYVRAKLDFSMDDLEDSYYGFGDNWIKGEDGYWYYTEVLKFGSYVDIFQGFKVPEDFSQEYEEQEIQLKIDVDAIQIKNFIPDYTSSKPWGDVEIQECIHEGDYNIQSLTVSNPKSFEIQYDKESKKLIKNEDDFFLNISALFPGDVYTDSLDLVNESNNPIKLYFHTFSEKSDLLNKIKLKITLKNGSDEKVIYNGNLNSKELEKQILLTQIAGKDEQQLIYTIEVPKELDNQYTLLNEHVRWMFSVEEISTKAPGNTSNKVQTGDSLDSNFALISMIVSGSVIVFLAYKKYRNGYEN